MAKQEKLKNYEISALSHKVFEEIKTIKLAKAKKDHSDKITEFVNEYKSLEKQEQALKDKKNKLSEDFAKKHKIYVGYNSYNETSLINQFAEFPQQENIEREIILKGIFSDKSELEEFIKELVKKFS